MSKEEKRDKNIQIRLKVTIASTNYTWETTVTRQTYSKFREISKTIFDAAASVVTKSTHFPYSEKMMRSKLWLLLFTQWLFFNNHTLLLVHNWISVELDRSSFSKSLFTQCFVMSFTPSITTYLISAYKCDYTLQTNSTVSAPPSTTTQTLTDLCRILTDSVSHANRLSSQRKFQSWTNEGHFSPDLRRTVKAHAATQSHCVFRTNHSVPKIPRVSCQHHGKIALILSIMYILCLVYLSMGSVKSYKKIPCRAQLYFNILNPCLEFELCFLYYYYEPPESILCICSNYGSKRKQKLVARQRKTKHWIQVNRW